MALDVCGVGHRSIDYPFWVLGGNVPRGIECEGSLEILGWRQCIAQQESQRLVRLDGGAHVLVMVLVLGQETGGPRSLVLGQIDCCR